MVTGIRVLCVDDEADLASLVAKYLTQTEDDITAETATSGAEALEKIAEESYDCLICDYQMPEMNGIEVLEAVRDEFGDLPFIIFTGKGSEDIASEAVRSGVSDYIPKSTGTDQYELLANRVRNVVEHQRAKQNTRELFNAADDAIIVHDPETGDIVDINEAGCNLWQTTQDALVGTSPGDLCQNPDNPDAWLADSYDFSQGPTDWLCTRDDGSTFWAEVRVQPATIDGQQRFLAISRDVTRRKRREERLSSLLTAAEELVASRDLKTIGSIVTETMRETLGFAGAALYVAERDEGVLNKVGSTGDLGADLAQADIRKSADEVYTIAGSDLRTDGGTGVDVSNTIERDSLLFWPIAEHGVLVGDPGTDHLTPFTTDLTDLFVALSQATVVRTFQERTLESQHAELESLNHMNEVIRDINQTLVKVTTRDEIEQLVCKQLAAAPPFVCSWIGEHNLTTQEIDVRVAVGRGADDVRTLPVTTEDDGGPLSAAFSRVVQDREVEVIEDLEAESIGSEYAAMAAEHRYESLTIVPITYQNALYDVLAIWAEETHPFGPQQRTVLGELGETIGYAMHTAERSRALLSDTAVELEYDISDAGTILYGLSAGLETTVELERIFFRADNSARIFLSVAGESTAAIRAELESLLDGDVDVREISIRDGMTIVEVAVDSLPMMKHLAEAMASIRSATATDGDGRLIIEVPNTVSVRTLTENLETIFDKISLLARRQRDVDDHSLLDVEDPTEMGLTDRQHEVLLTAYHAGFFAWPRESTGEEIAELLDISQPTYHEHLRTGERKLLELLFENRRSVYT